MFYFCHTLATRRYFCQFKMLFIFIILLHARDLPSSIESIQQLVNVCPTCSAAQILADHPEMISSILREYKELPHHFHSSQTSNSPLISDSINAQRLLDQSGLQISRCNHIQKRSYKCFLFNLGLAPVIFGLSSIVVNHLGLFKLSAVTKEIINLIGAFVIVVSGTFLMSAASQIRLRLVAQDTVNEEPPLI
eukprot:NODE_395_length_8134_cov_0.767393.p7 type:complete len:192 gc:universal NODE_395_length_8134_cov_0.767393:4325-4900(+)